MQERRLRRVGAGQVVGRLSRGQHRPGLHHLELQQGEEASRRVRQAVAAQERRQGSTCEGKLNLAVGRLDDGPAIQVLADAPGAGELFRTHTAVRDAQGFMAVLRMELVRDSVCYDSATRRERAPAGLSGR